MTSPPTKKKNINQIYLSKTPIHPPVKNHADEKKI